MKKFLFITFLLLGISIYPITCNAQVIQLDEGNKCVDLYWNNKTDTNFQLGYAEYQYNGDYVDGALKKAKTLANKGKIKLSNHKNYYKLKHLKKNTNYVVVLRYTKNGQVKYSINTYVYTKMLTKVNINTLDNIQAAYPIISWTAIPGAKYEVKISSESGNIEQFYSNINVLPLYKYINQQQYNIQVRAIRKSPNKYNKIKKKHSKWSKKFTFITQ